MGTAINWFGQILRLFLFTVLVRGSLEFLGRKDVHPENRVADLMDWATDPASLELISWGMATVIGLLLLIAWDWFRPFARIRASIQGHVPHSQGVTGRGKMGPLILIGIGIACIVAGGVWWLVGSLSPTQTATAVAAKAAPREVIEVSEKIKAWSLANSYSLEEKQAPSENGFRYWVTWLGFSASVSFKTGSRYVEVAADVGMGRYHRGRYEALPEADKQRVDLKLRKVMMEFNAGGGELDTVRRPGYVSVRELLPVDEMDEPLKFYRKVESLRRFRELFNIALIEELGVLPAGQKSE